MAKKSPVKFELVLNALLNLRQPFPATLLHHFSDLQPQDFAALKRIWSQVNPDRKASLLEDLEMLAETDSLVNFDQLSKFALTDLSPQVRAIATRLLWETDDSNLIQIFIDMLEKDPDDVVRASAATALSQYVFYGELDELSPLIFNKILSTLLKVIHGQDKPLVRRRALESIGYATHAEVPILLRQYISSDDPEWVASALFAMGRSLNESWENDVLRFLSNPEPQIQLESIRAAGAMELNSARETLMSILDEDLDDEIRFAVIWSLSQIGGEGVRHKLEDLFENSEDDEEADLIEEAIENLSYSEMESLHPFLEIPIEPGSSLSGVIDLEKTESDGEDLASPNPLNQAIDEIKSRKRHKPTK